MQTKRIEFVLFHVASLIFLCRSSPTRQIGRMLGAERRESRGDTSLLERCRETLGFFEQLRNMKDILGQRFFLAMDRPCEPKIWLHGTTNSLEIDVPRLISR